MGVDIHTFIEYKAGDKWESLDVYIMDEEYLTEREKLHRVEPYVGRDSCLFDILYRKLPDLGVPEDASKVFQQEWKDYSKPGGGGYGCNYILFSDLLNLFKHWEETDFLNLQNIIEGGYVSNLAETTFYFINSLFNRVSTLIDCHILYHKSTEAFCNYRLIYFFDR